MKLLLEQYKHLKLHPLKKTTDTDLPYQSIVDMGITMPLKINFIWSPLSKRLSVNKPISYWGVIINLAPEVYKIGGTMTEMSEMSEMFKKMGLFGIGVISLTQEKIEEFSQEMIKKGELSREEGKKFVKEVLSEKEKQMEEFEEKINEKIKETFKKSGVVMKSDITALEKKIEKLEKTIEAMAKKQEN